MTNGKHPGTQRAPGRLHPRDSLRWREAIHLHDSHTDPREVREFAKKKDAELDRQRSRVRAGLPGRMRFSALLHQV